MKKDYLLPVGFKKIGWILLLPSVLLGCYMLFLQDKLNWLDSLNEHLLNNTALIGTAIGLIFIGFAREHNEDEMITSLRLNSLFISVYANYILLILLALCFYDFEFLTCMFVLLYTIPAIYYLLSAWPCTGLTKRSAMKNRIRVERAEVRMTQQQLADAIGVSRQTVNAIEAGRFVPSTVLALKIARIFGKPVEQVFQLEEGD